MLVGLDVHRSDAYDEVLQLAELLGMQVVQGLSPFTDFPTDHPLYVGQSDRAFTPFRSLEGADVLLNMGSPMLYQEGAAPIVSPYWKIIECRTAPNDVARWTGDTVPIVADVKESAGALLEAVKSGMTADARAKAKDRFDKIADFNRKVALTREAMAEERKDQIPIAWEHVAREAQRQLEPDAIITHEFNSAMPRVLPWLSFGRGKKELFGRTLGSGLGWSVGAAVGIKMAKPDRQTVCLIGDGAFLMGQIEALWAARRFEAPVLYVVFNNRSFNDTRMRVSAIAPRLREFKLDMGSYLGNPDVSFETAAKAFDVNGATVTRPGEIAPALARGIKELKDGRPFVIDVVAERVGLLAEFDLVSEIFHCRAADQTGVTGHDEIPHHRRHGRRRFGIDRIGRAGATPYRRRSGQAAGWRRQIRSDCVLCRRLPPGGAICHDAAKSRGVAQDGDADGRFRRPAVPRGRRHRDQIPRNLLVGSRHAAAEVSIFSRRANLALSAAVTVSDTSRLTNVTISGYVLVIKRFAQHGKASGAGP